MHAYDVYFLGSQLPLSYYLILTEFASNKFGKNYEPNFVSIKFSGKGRIGVF